MRLQLFFASLMKVLGRDSPIPWDGKWVPQCHRALLHRLQQKGSREGHTGP